MYLAIASAILSSLHIGYRHGSSRSVPLNKVWSKMGLEKRWVLVKALSCYQKAWTSVSFDRFGSLYYSKDLNDNNQCLSYVNSDGARVDDTMSCVGPSTARDSIVHGRMSIECDRGPCKNRSRHLDSSD